MNNKGIYDKTEEVITNLNTSRREAADLLKALEACSEMLKTALAEKEELE